jgi:hypothetical protein
MNLRRNSFNNFFNDLHRQRMCTGLTQKIATESRRRSGSGNILQSGIPSPACFVVTLRRGGSFFFLRKP